VVQVVAHRIYIFTVQGYFT